MGRSIAILLLVAAAAAAVGEVFNVVPGASRCCVETPIGDVAVQAAPYFLIGAFLLALAATLGLVALLQRWW